MLHQHWNPDNQIKGQSNQPYRELHACMHLALGADTCRMSAKYDSVFVHMRFVEDFVLGLPLTLCVCFLCANNCMSAYGFMCG